MFKVDFTGAKIIVMTSCQTDCNGIIIDLTAINYYEQ